jgi:3-hydroxyisobutyrate dehydrogenase-like beta-hydroxyacid dehydrogenase
MAKETVGIIGLGAMGTPMANNLLAAGFTTWVFDIDKARVDAVVRSGAKAAESPRRLAANVRAPRCSWQRR